MVNKSATVAFAVVAGAMLVGFGWQGDGFKRERSGATAALKDGVEGKPPPPLTASAWMNLEGKAPTWESLKGKVVVLDFWAHW